MSEQTGPEQPIARWSLHTAPPKDDNWVGTIRVLEDPPPPDITMAFRDEASAKELIGRTLVVNVYGERRSYTIADVTPIAPGEWTLALSVTEGHTNGHTGDTASPHRDED